MLSCTKKYSDIPFAHRQPKHDGHCRLIHGHNWAFEFEFTAEVTDENGFVADFGKLKDLKEWVNRFDHALALNENDPLVDFLQKLDRPIGVIAKIITVPDASCEGLAQLAYAVASGIVESVTQKRAKVSRVTIYEDSKNSATYIP